VDEIFCYKEDSEYLRRLIEKEVKVICQHNGYCITTNNGMIIEIRAEMTSLLLRVLVKICFIKADFVYYGNGSYSSNQCSSVQYI
jgi:hypothetical protein